MTQSFWLDGPLPGVNELIAAAKLSGRIGKRGGRWNKYSEIKEAWNDKICAACGEEKLKRVKRAWIVFIWHEKARRRDPDNISGGGRKLILDGLKQAGVLPDDSGKYVAGWEDRFVWGSDTPGVLVEVYDNEDHGIRNGSANGSVCDCSDSGIPRRANVSRKARVDKVRKVPVRRVSRRKRG